MLIKFKDIVKKYKKPKGIIHLGAHLAEELSDYLEFGMDNVVWVEANPNLIEKLKNKIKNTSHKAFSYLLSDSDDQNMNFNITKNNRNGNNQSSSVLDLGTHKKHYPFVEVVETIELETKTIETVFRNNNLQFNDFDFINLDLQGYELPVLKGFGSNLSKMQYIYTEVNAGEVYKNCSKIDEIDDYLLKFNFERVETYFTPEEWGDALYVKKND
jgi:FkbM family methyltransferase